MDLSIIVPVYNTPKAFLEKCFHSIYGLHDIDFELLIVDDGSQKSVGDYCSQYASHHVKCRYFRKENSGVSAARNMGLAEAEGDFVMFVDSDDELLPDVFHVELWGGTTSSYMTQSCAREEGKSHKMVLEKPITRRTVRYC